MSDNGKPQNSLLLLFASLTSQQEENKSDRINGNSNGKTSRIPKSLKEKTLWQWLDLIVAPLAIAVGAALVTIIWQWSDNRQADKQELARYHQQLVKEYTDSVQVLVLDKYHHETNKFPEILPGEVESFVKSYTGTTIKALNGNIQQINVITNFLRRSEIGFLSETLPIDEKKERKILEICDRKPSKKKDKEYKGFLCEVNLARANLKESKLSRGVLGKALLSEANLTKVDLDGAFLQEANLTKANFTEASLVNAKLKGALLKGANFTEANLQNANLRDSNLTPASGRQPSTNKLSERKRAILRKAILKKADLREADLREADLTGADLTGADLRGAILIDTRISQETKLKDALFDSSTQLKFIKRIRNQDKAIQIDNKSAQKHYRMLMIPNKTHLRQANPQQVNLRKADLKDADLTNADLKQANLQGANLTDADLTNAKLQQANLQGANLIDAVFTDIFTANFDKDAIKANFDLFENFDFTNQDFYSRSIDHFDPDSDITDAIVAIVPDGNFTNNNIPDLTGADLSKANFRGADLTDSKINDKTIFTNALFDSETRLPFTRKDASDKGMWEISPDADLTSANLTEADLTNAVLTNAYLNGADLSKANFRGADLTNSKINDKTIFTNALFDSKTQLPFDREKALAKGMWKISPDANLTGADLTNAKLTNAKLTNANLTRANLSCADLTNADLRGANLYYADLTSANLTGADLTNADLREANLYNADLTNVDLTGAKLRYRQLKLQQPRSLCNTINPLGWVLRRDC